MKSEDEKHIDDIVHEMIEEAPRFSSKNSSFPHFIQAKVESDTSEVMQ
jgi:hypothetical protein